MTAADGRGWTTQSASHTQAEAVAWANGKVGQALDFDGAYGAQCVDFTCFYYQYLGQGTPWGNANQYVNGGAFCPAGWSYQGSPQPGDIAVWAGYSPGHVAIVTEIRGSQMVCVEQNYAGRMYVTPNLHNIDATTYIRPDWPADSSPAPTTSVNFSRWENGNYTYVAETDASIGQQIDVANGNATDTGMVLYDKNRNELARKANGSFYYRVYFKINAELGYRLTPGVTYQYRFWAVVDGTTYWSNYQSFTTAGSTSLSVNFGPWENGNYTYIRDTDASIGQQIDVTGGNPTNAGMVLYNNDRVQLGSKTEGTFYYRMYYKINEELGVTLVPGCTYQYRFFAIVDGQTYWSGYQSFRTSGSHSHTYDTTVMPATFDSDGGVSSVCTLCRDKGSSTTVSRIEEVQLSQNAFGYDGDSQWPTATATDGAGNAIDQEYYTVAYESPESAEVGQYKATVIFTGNYSGEKTLEYSIRPADLSDASVKAPGQVFTGIALTPAVTVTFDGKTLVAGTDYDVSYEDNVNAGTAIVTVTGKGNYTGTKSATFEIIANPEQPATPAGPADPTEPTAGPTPTVEPEPAGPSEPAVEPTVPTGQSPAGNPGDGDQQQPGSAAAKLTNIAGSAITNVEPKAYTGKALTQSPTVTLGGEPLEAGTDYELTYSNNVNVGTATMTVTGKGNYTGTKSATFEIIAADLSDATISGLTDKTYTGETLTQNPTVQLGSVTLTPGTDYTVGYKDNVNAGTAIVTVTGKGNYTGTKSATFIIGKTTNPMTAKAKSPSVKAAKVKKSNQSITAKKAFVVSKAQGKVTYKKTSGNKKIAVSSTGKITVKKGLKKGTYKVKVNVTATGNANYRSSSKTVTVNIVVK